MGTQINVVSESDGSRPLLDLGEGLVIGLAMPISCRTLNGQSQRRGYQGTSGSYNGLIGTAAWEQGNLSIVVRDRWTGSAASCVRLDRLVTCELLDRDQAPDAVQFQLTFALTDPVAGTWESFIPRPFGGGREPGLVRALGLDDPLAWPLIAAHHVGSGRTICILRQHLMPERVGVLGGLESLRAVHRAGRSAAVAVNQVGALGLLLRWPRAAEEATEADAAAALYPVGQAGLTVELAYEIHAF